MIAIHFTSHMNDHSLADVDVPCHDGWDVDSEDRDELVLLLLLFVVWEEDVSRAGSVFLSLVMWLLTLIIHQNSCIHSALFVHQESDINLERLSADPGLRW